MSIKIQQIQATIKVSPIYTCSKCGKRSVGDTIRTEFSGNGSDDLKDHIDNLRASSHYMPVGWSFNGEFDCGCQRDIMVG